MKTKLNSFKNFLTLLVVGAVMMACNKSMQMEHVPTKMEAMPMNTFPIQVNVEADGDWLYFPSLHAFNAVMTELHGRYADAKGLQQWESAFNQQGFTSLRKHYERIDADDSENRQAPTVEALINANKLLDCPDSWFATVLSHDGYIRIADTVYSFRPGQENGEAFAVPVKHRQELIKGADPKRLSGTKVHVTSFVKILVPSWQDSWHVSEPQPTPSDPNPKHICEYPTKLMPNWWGQSGGDIYWGNDGTPFPKHNGRDIRLNYHRWRVGYIFYASAGIRLQLFKHTRFAGWLSNVKAKEMIMESCCKGKIFIPGLPLIGFNEQTSPTWPSFARYGVSTFEKTMKWTASGVFNEIYLEHFNFHFKVNYEGVQVEKYIRQ